MRLIRFPGLSKSGRQDYSRLRPTLHSFHGKPNLGLIYFGGIRPRMMGERGDYLLVHEITPDSRCEASITIHPNGTADIYVQRWSPITDRNQTVTQESAWIGTDLCYENCIPALHLDYWELPDPQAPGTAGDEYRNPRPAFALTDDHQWLPLYYDKLTTQLTQIRGFDPAVLERYQYASAIPYTVNPLLTNGEAQIETYLRVQRDDDPITVYYKKKLLMIPNYGGIIAGPSCSQLYANRITAIYPSEHGEMLIARSTLTLPDSGTELSKEEVSLTPHPNGTLSIYRHCYYRIQTTQNALTHWVGFSIRLDGVVPRESAHFWEFPSAMPYPDEPFSLCE